jgi:hypothetical protein
VDGITGHDLAVAIRLAHLFHQVPAELCQVDAVERHRHPSLVGRSAFARSIRVYVRSLSTSSLKGSEDLQRWQYQVLPRAKGQLERVFYFLETHCIYRSRTISSM